MSEVANFLQGLHYKNAINDNTIKAVLDQYIKQMVSDEHCFKLSGYRPTNKTLTFPPMQIAVADQAFVVELSVRNALASEYWGQWDSISVPLDDQKDYDLQIKKEPPLNPDGSKQDPIFALKKSPSFLSASLSISPFFEYSHTHNYSGHSYYISGHGNISKQEYLSRMESYPIKENDIEQIIQKLQQMQIKLEIDPFNNATGTEDLGAQYISGSPVSEM
jgi:hypothetical protein